MRRMLGSMKQPWREVGERVFVRRYGTWRGLPFDQNIGVILGANGAVVVDTRASHRLADDLLAELRTLTRDPIAAVVNTHHHWDHTWGNARLLPAPTWGHRRCAERVVSDSDEARRRLIEEDASLAEELSEVAFTPPGQLFDERATIDLGDRQLELRHLGRGHTDNDIVVLIPDADVVFGGDLVENDAPPSFGDAFPIAWAETASRLAALVDGALVPGHGSVGDAGFAERQVAELVRVAEIGRSVVAGEQEETEAARRGPYPAAIMATAIERVRRELAFAG
jgi:glyoxylase-like metal-dependent hydrolase (beta-lactamase superfamily II)